MEASPYILPPTDTAHYNQIYQRQNYFNQREWLYQPLIQALSQKAQLPKKSQILDLACGQGFFTSLFANLGFTTLGVDLSSEGIKSAAQQYGSTGAKFEVGDVVSLPYQDTFDCVFVRSFNFYNSPDFESNPHITEIFLSYLKPGGTFIFLYSTKLCPLRRSQSWPYRSFNSLRKHFSFYPQAKTFFSVRLDALLLHSLALSPLITNLSILLSTCTGVGGELIGIVKKPSGRVPYFAHDHLR